MDHDHTAASIRSGDRPVRLRVQGSKKPVPVPAESEQRHKKPGTGAPDFTLFLHILDSFHTSIHYTPLTDQKNDRRALK